MYDDATNRHQLKINEKMVEVDVFIESLNLAIEYNGAYFHKNRIRDERKAVLLQENGLKFITINESKNYQKDKKNQIFIELPINDDKLNTLVTRLINRIDSKVKCNPNIARDRIRIYEQYISQIKLNSFEVKSLDKVYLWNNEKNGELLPSMFPYGSQKKVWWKCEKGHEWEAAINKVSNGSGCPICSGKKVLVGYNDLFSVHPNLKSIWAYDLNNEINPLEVTSGSGKMVHWRCQVGHVWRESISKISSGRRCPYCSNKRVLVGFNDLLTTHPETGKLWNYGRNSTSPKEYTFGSNKKVWWKCDKGHEWKTTVSEVVSGKRCPYCSNKAVLVGFNDLLTTHPEIGDTWNYERNDTSPKEYTFGSGKKVWWKCDLGHEWQAVIHNRTRGHGCPYCSGNKTIKGY
jgi:DNA-directed RNA polymerase subunit RPC12/RpoP